MSRHHTCILAASMVPSVRRHITLAHEFCVRTCHRRRLEEAEGGWAAAEARAVDAEAALGGKMI